jgi:hypothetical protein
MKSAVLLGQYADNLIATLIEHFLIALVDPHAGFGTVSR